MVTSELQKRKKLKALKKLHHRRRLDNLLLRSIFPRGIAKQVMANGFCSKLLLIAGIWFLAFRGTVSVLLTCVGFFWFLHALAKVPFGELSMRVGAHWNWHHEPKEWPPIFCCLRSRKIKQIRTSDQSNECHNNLSLAFSYRLQSSSIKLSFRLIGKVVRFLHRGTHWWAAPFYQKQRNWSGLNSWLDCLASWYTSNLNLCILL